MYVLTSVAPSPFRSNPTRPWKPALLLRKRGLRHIRVRTITFQPARPECQNFAMVLGLTYAILAALGSGIGSAVEAFGVRRAAAGGKLAGDLGPLLREPVYFIGLTVDLLGFAFTVLALQILPLFLVQAVVASSVAVTALIVAATGRPLGRPGWIALCASLTGLVLLGLSSQAHDVPPLASGWHWLLLGLALPMAGCGALAMRVKGSWSAVLLAFTAGLTFTCVAVSARSLDLPEPAWRIVTEPSMWAIVVNGLLGTVLFALALQRGRVTVVAAVTFTTNTVLPALIGIFLLGDQVRSGYALVAIAGFLVSVGGAIALAQFAGPLPANPPASLQTAANTGGRTVSSPAPLPTGQRVIGADDPDM